MSGKMVRRTNLKLMVTTDLVIAQMTALSAKDNVSQIIIFEDGKEENKKIFKLHVSG